jgi:hypothetical protein
MGITVYDGHGMLVDWAASIAPDSADVIVMMSSEEKDAFASLPVCRNQSNDYEPVKKSGIRTKDQEYVVNCRRAC